MDALALGIPLVCLDGADLAARVDPVLLRHAGLDELCTANQEGYLALVQRVLAGDAGIHALAQSALANLAAAAAHAPPGNLTLAGAILERWNERIA